METPSRWELLESDARGFRVPWPVAASYRVEGDALLEGSGTIKEYFPITRAELPFEFIKIAESGDAEILKFAARYGLLGYEAAAATTLSVYKYPAAYERR